MQQRKKNIFKVTLCGTCIYYDVMSRFDRPLKSSHYKDLKQQKPLESSFCKENKMVELSGIEPPTF